MPFGLDYTPPRNRHYLRWIAPGNGNLVHVATQISSFTAAQLVRRF